MQFWSILATSYIYIYISRVWIIAWMIIWYDIWYYDCFILKLWMNDFLWFFTVIFFGRWRCFLLNNLYILTLNIIEILLMEEILHRLICMKPVNKGIYWYTTISTGAGFLLLTVIMLPLSDRHPNLISTLDCFKDGYYISMGRLYCTTFFVTIYYFQYLYD